MSRDRWTGVRLNAFEHRAAEFMAARARTTVAAIIRAALSSAARTALGSQHEGASHMQRLRAEMLRSAAEHDAVLERAGGAR